MRVWALDLDDLIEIAEREVTRTLTEQECRQYLHRGALPLTSPWAAIAQSLCFQALK